ncbi:hypothetical protein ig2599ANME_1651 [groundwater metagenome]
MMATREISEPEVQAAVENGELEYTGATGEQLKNSRKTAKSLIL